MLIKILAISICLGISVFVQLDTAGTPNPVPAFVATGLGGRLIVKQEGTLKRFDARLELPEVDLTKPNSNIFPIARADLGKLQVGQSHEFDFSIFNPTESDIEFRKVVTGCSCGQVTFESNIFPSGKELKGRLKYQAPPSAFDPTVQMAIWFYNVEDRGDSLPVASMQIRLSLAENLAVKASSNQLVITDEGDNRFEFPITVTDPIAVENLVVEKSDSLRDVEAIIDNLDGNPRLVVQVASRIVEAGGVNGDIAVKDKISHRTVRLNFWLAKRPAVSISPQFVRFRESKEQNGRYTALVLVRVCPKQKSGEVPELTRLECMHDDSVLPASSRELGSGVYSITLEYPESTAKTESGVSERTGVLEWNLELITSDGELEAFSATTNFEGVLR